MSGLDLGIVVAYIVLMLFLGTSFGRRAAKSIDSYFLGERRLPWWLLGISGAASYFDITGTMWIVSLFFLIGVKGMWVHWMWGFLGAAFFAAYMGKWIRRSGVMTGAEWMKTRFGEGRDGEAARLAYAILAVVTVIAFLAYATVGIGKFASVYLPWSRNACAGLILGTASVYVILGGMYGVVFTDLLQAAILGLGAVVLSYVAFVHADPSVALSRTPHGWLSFAPSWRVGYLEGTPYYLFGALCLVWVLKGLLLSAGGPQQLYDFQRFLAARNAREASKAGLIWGFVLVPRWTMTMGITLLALAGALGVSDPEKVLPLVIKRMLPVGLKGLIMAGFLAAFMSTFDSTVNGGASYIVRDIYQHYINPKASERKLVLMSYLASAFLIGTGVLIGFRARTIADVFNWIMVALGGGVLVPNVLRWYWWRLNGWGYTAGILSGLFSSLLQAAFFPKAPMFVYFPVIVGISTVASVAASLLTKPTDESVLVNFYRTVKPGGFWGPIRERAGEPKSSPSDAPFLLDLFNALVGMALFLGLYMAGVYLILHRFGKCLFWTSVAAVSGLILNFSWAKNLPSD